MRARRVTDFRGGVYKQFAIAGPARYVVDIKRNRSYVTKLLGLFIDRAVTDPSVKKTPLPGFENVKYSVPDLPDNLDTDGNPALSAASDLWDELVATVNKRGAIGLEDTVWNLGLPRRRRRQGPRRDACKLALAIVHLEPGRPRRV